MEAYTFRIYLIGGSIISLQGCDDDMIEMLLEKFKQLDKDEFLEQDYGYGGYICVPVRNILYVDTYLGIHGPLA